MRNPYHGKDFFRIIEIRIKILLIESLNSMKKRIPSTRKAKVRSPRFRIKNAQQKLKNEKRLNHASKHPICCVDLKED